MPGILYSYSTLFSLCIDNVLILKTIVFKVLTINTLYCLVCCLCLGSPKFGLDNMLNIFVCLFSSL